MKYQLYILFLGIIGCLPLSGQQSDKIWLAGLHDGNPVNGNVLIHFQDNQIELTPLDLHMNFERTVAVAADSSDNLLFYTNGCWVANAEGDTMPNGEGLNPGEMHDWTCPEAGYITPMGAMALQWPGHPNLYMLIHLGARYEPEKKLRYGPLYYTVIDMSLENGKGAVVSKNNVLLDASLEPFAAVRHGNGRDWWLVIPEYGTNRYYRFLLSPEGLNNAGNQQIGPALTCKQIRPSVFSPDGAHFARPQNCGVCVLDFDRCSGFWANPRLLSWPPHAFGGGGVAFSPNGELLYATTQMAILSADLTATVPQLDTAVSWSYIAGNSLALMQYGPDEKVYIGNMGRSSNYHVFGNLNNPDQTLDFQAQGLALPAQVIHSLPNYPNFRLLDQAGSICDTLNINTSISTGLPFTAAPSIEASPNPANDAATITISGAREGQLTLRSVDGRLMMQTMFVSETEKSVQILELTSYPAGTYFLSLLSKEGGLNSVLLNIQH